MQSRRREDFDFDFDSQPSFRQDMQQSRRREDLDIDRDLASQSTFGRSRRNADVGPDGYLTMSPRSKRSWSPRRQPAEGPPEYGRMLGGRRSVSVERRRIVEDDRRRIIRSRSPPYMEAKRGRPVYSDDWGVDRELPTPERRSRYEFFNRMDAKYDDFEPRSRSPPTRNEFGYGHDASSRTVIADDKFEGRRVDGGMREIGSQKPAVMGLYRPIGDGHATESGGDIPSASLNVGLGQIVKERVRYPDVHQPSYPFDKYAAMKQYDDGENNMVRGPRDSPYSNMTASRSKESMGPSHLKDYARTPPRKPRVDHLGYRGGIPLPRDNHNHPLNSTDIPPPLSHPRYEERQHLDLGRDPDLDINEEMGRYRRETFSPPRPGHLDTLRVQPRIRERVDYLYPSDEIYEKMNLSERVEYNDREMMLKPNLLDHHVTQRAETSDFARRNMSSRSSLDHLSLERLPATNNIGLSRSPAEKRESVQYLDTASVHSRLGRKISREQELEMPYMGMVQDREIEHMRVDHHGYKRDVGPGSQKERTRSSPGFLYETERIIRPVERTHKREGRDLSPYHDSSGRFLKRKYPMDDDENRIPSRTITSRLDTVTRRQNREYSDEEWVDQDASGSYFTKRRDQIQTHGFNRRVVDKGYDEADEEWFSSHDPEEHMHDHHRMKPYKYEDKYAKGYSRSGYRGGYNNSYHPNKKHVVTKWKNNASRGENDEEVDMYENRSSGVKSEPHEGSDEFKQMVHEFFLSFMKKLNEAPGVRRRYMEQGRAGSLFCIVCGRSLSKEFLDTQRLAMHAFMSHKVGLRAQHLGLLKAICVMLGWDAAIPPGTIRWYPETLSSSDILVQKEDLIIWPPVIIVHNTSISNNDSNGQGPTNEEALGQFLRGKGLSGGKVRVGKHANCSVMLVKFLGTFSGLQEAERIHQYFAKNKHGRKELEHMSSGKGKGKGENGNGDKDGEGVLFGYMGIAEDLDKVDFDTKRKCTIKSKKEIHDIADAPVKAE